MQPIGPFHPDYKRFVSYYPEVSANEVAIIIDYWNTFWLHPEQFVDTGLIDIVLPWVRNEINTRKWEIFDRDTKKYLGSIDYKDASDEFEAIIKAEQVYGRGNIYVSLKCTSRK